MVTGVLDPPLYVDILHCRNFREELILKICQKGMELIFKELIFKDLSINELVTFSKDAPCTLSNYLQFRL